MSDIELSERGKAQADRLGGSLKDERVDTIVSSPLKRAVQTAEAINRFHNLPIQYEDDLMELNLGDFEGIVLQEMRVTHGDFLKRWIKDPASIAMPAGESLTELQERAWGAVERIITRPGGAPL